MLDKTYQPIAVEEKIYKMWEEGNYFTPKIDWQKTPFSILLPLPNANDPLHMGHALFTIQDILIRYHRMKGDPTLWLPGGDHAGIETQYVYEKQLSKEGKSRFDFDRETLYRMISDFVEKNRNLNRDQMKRLGFSLDWTRYHYSLEPKIVEKILATFQKMHKDKLIYRGERMVNYCPKCGTAFSDLEINYVERKDPLYYLKYGPFILATTRPETKFGDTAVAYHPGDKRYEKYLGQEIEIQGVNGPFKVKVIADEEIDPEFGTGIEKVTPAHDMLDFEIGKRHNLPIKTVIDRNGRLTGAAGRFAGLRVGKGREAVVEEMKKQDLIDHIDENYTHNIAVCYRCGTTIEPMLLPQWFVKTKPLAEPAIKAVREGKTKIVPKKRFEKMYFDWMENIHDWNISRQVVWGPRIPVWYCLDCNPNLQINFIDKNGSKVSGLWKDLRDRYNFEEIKSGLQSLVAEKDATYQLKEGECPQCRGSLTLQETDTFDTWFLSGQWPLTTLSSNSEDFKYFYPTSVLDTLWDILFFWVGRMMMFGLYLAQDVPFKVVHIHARVTDKFGVKMSKSKGNVIDPLPMINQYGADALRLALVIGVAPASDIALSDEKVRGMRNFSNKIWNIGRFILMNIEGQGVPWYEKNLTGISEEDKKIVKKLEEVIKSTTKDLEDFRLGQAAENLYQFVWHEFADSYIEAAKERIKNGDLVVLSVARHVYFNSLKLLHPFMPFVTEELWQNFPRLKSDPLIISPWPKGIKS